MIQHPHPGCFQFCCGIVYRPSCSYVDAGEVPPAVPVPTPIEVGIAADGRLDLREVLLQSVEYLFVPSVIAAFDVKGHPCVLPSSKAGPIRDARVDGRRELPAAVTATFEGTG